MERKQKPSQTLNPATFEHVYSFDEIFREDHNSLWVDPRKRLWLSDGNENGIDRSGEFVPIKESDASDFEPVSLKNALVWYATINRFSKGGIGSVALLCELAAKHLKEK